MYREGKKCIIYSRVSTEMQIDGYSLEGQKNSIRRFADREEMIIVDEYEDAGKSGKSIEGRPSFMKMLNDIKKGLEIDYILCYKLSRFGRNAADILNSLDMIQSYDINLICIEEGIDSSQASGKLLISVLSAVSEIERENILEQTMNGRREKARQGRWNGGMAPYGYGLKDNLLYINEYEAKAIRIIFEKYTNQDWGYHKIAKYLNDQGIMKIVRGTMNNKYWSSNMMRRILENPVYCGDIAYGRRSNERVKGTKNKYRIVPQDEYIREKGIHEPIISRELFEKTQCKLKSNFHKALVNRKRTEIHLLSGILRCPKCGGPMYSNRDTWTLKDGTEKRLDYYTCSRAVDERGIRCNYSKKIEKVVIESMVIDTLSQIVKDSYFSQMTVPGSKKNSEEMDVVEEINNYKDRLLDAQSNKSRLEKDIDMMPFDALYRDRKISDMQKRLDTLYERIIFLEEQIEDAKIRKKAIEEKALNKKKIEKIFNNFAKFYELINETEKKLLLGKLIKKIDTYAFNESELPLKSIEFNFPIYNDSKKTNVAIVHPKNFK